MIRAICEVGRGAPGHPGEDEGLVGSRVYREEGLALGRWLGEEQQEETPWWQGKAGGPPVPHHSGETKAHRGCQQARYRGYTQNRDPQTLLGSVAEGSRLRLSRKQHTNPGGPLLTALALADHDPIGPHFTDRETEVLREHREDGLKPRWSPDSPLVPLGWLQGAPTSSASPSGEEPLPPRALHSGALGQHSGSASPKSTVCLLPFSNY